MLYLGLYGSASSMAMSPSPSLKSGPRLGVAPGDWRTIEVWRDEAVGDAYESCLCWAGALASLWACC
jgi:hypothetical protein